MDGEHSTEKEDRRKKKNSFWTPQEQYKAFGPREIKSEPFDQKSPNSKRESRAQKRTQVWQDSDGQRPFDSPNILLLPLLYCPSASPFPSVCFLGALPHHSCAIVLFLTQLFTFPYPEVSPWALTSHSLWSSFHVVPCTVCMALPRALEHHQWEGWGWRAEPRPGSTWGRALREGLCVGRAAGGFTQLCVSSGFKQPTLHGAESALTPGPAHKSEMNLDTLFQQIELTGKKAGEKRRLIQQGQPPSCMSHSVGRCKWPLHIPEYPNKSGATPL